MSILLKIAIAAAVAAIPVFFWKDIKNSFKPGEPTPIAGVKVSPADTKSGKKKGGKKDEEKKETEDKGSEDVEVLRKWDLPASLAEVSGITYLKDSSFACVEDENGIIYIYNLSTARVEKQIRFGGPGDYEGIALVKETAYVVRSDGKLFEVQDFMSGNPKVKEYATPLNAKHDVEGLCYDAQANRLLLAIKGRIPDVTDYKGIFAFDLATKKLISEPVVRIDMHDKLLEAGGGKDESKNFQPSEVDIHPLTGELYLTEGAKPKLVIMSKTGKIAQIYPLKRSDFPQAEGLAFTRKGELYISNEGQNGRATILHVKIQE